MNKPLLAALSTLAIAGAGVAPAVAAPQVAPKAAAVTVDFSRHRLAQQLLRLGHPVPELDRHRPGAGHDQRALPGDRFPGAR